MSLLFYLVLFTGKIFPSLYLHWKKYQGQLLDEIKTKVITGDGRHNSMGHSAKCCAYTVFCCTVPIHNFALIQV